MYMFTDILSLIPIPSLFSSAPQSFAVASHALQNITSREIVDILVVSTALYVVLLFIKQTKSYFLIGVSILIVFVSIISQNLDLSLTRTILQPLSTLTFIIIAIVFQREIRRFFKWIVTGQSHIFSFSSTKQISKGTSGEIAEALLYMSAKRIGGILVFTVKQELDDIVEGGQRLGGEITKEIILSIFDTSSAGHDGAIIIDHDLIKQFGVHLPLAREYSDYRKVGTRHRAAAGITEDTDSIAFAVSEERGTISVFKEGQAEIIKDEEELRELLKTLTGEIEDEKTNFWKYFFFSNLGSKAIAFSITLLVWLLLFVQSGITRKEYTVPVSFQLIPASLELDSKSGVKEIVITVEGKTRDISLVDTSKLEVKIDGKNFSTTTSKIEINKSMLNTPSFVQVLTIEPKSISVRLLEKTVASSQKDDENNAIKKP
jgi:diadenylate cyclase